MIADADIAARPTREEWAALRRAEGPRSLAADGKPRPLLAYQARLLTTVSASAVTVYEKSRRTGVTWAAASLAVATSGAEKSAGGMDTLYVGYNLDMAREFIDACAGWARRIHIALASIDEFLFDDGGPDRQIKAFRITFPSGFDIVALASRPRSLRGRQGLVIIDEAAFHDDFKGLLEAALALLMWGGKVLVISTHFGRDNRFNVLVNDIRAGRKPYALLRTDFDDALRDGLFERVCAAKGEVWSPEAEADYRDMIVANYGEAAEEELYCVPAEGEGAWLPATLIEARQDATAPVLRWEQPKSFVDLSAHLREAAARDFCEQRLLPALARLDRGDLHALGGDFGRIHDLSVFWPLATKKNMRRETPFVVELRNIPFEQQRFVLHFMLDRLPRLSAVALDAGGNGAWLAEVTAQRYGALVAQVKFSTEWYRQHMPPLKAAFEDAMITIPADRDQYEDLRLVRLIKGVAMVPPRRTKGADGGKRHGDAAIALALANAASRMRVESYGYTPAYVRDLEDDDDDARDALAPDRHGRLL